MLPTPKNLKIIKIVKQVEINNPFFELLKIKENIKNKNNNRITKKINIKIEDLGSTKYTIETRVKNNIKVMINDGRKLFLFKICFFLISLFMLYN